MNRFKRKVAGLFSVVLLIGCQLDVKNPELPVTLYRLEGIAQKGPFIQGTSINIQSLDEGLNPTGKNYQTQTIDDFGRFELTSSITSRFIEVIANGYYFDETSGSISPSQLTLRAIADLSLGEAVNVNLLTTLEEGRIRELLLTRNIGFNKAQELAEQEVLRTFGISLPFADQKFSSMDISQSGDKNAILLAVSVTLQNKVSVGQLSQTIAKISDQVAQSGKITDSSLQDSIRTAQMDLANNSQIRNFLANRYSSLGLNSVVIPPFEDYLDFNGNGIINRNEVVVSSINWRSAGNLPFSPFGWGSAKLFAFKDNLFCFDGTRLWESINGKEWQLKDPGPVWAMTGYYFCDFAAIGDTLWLYRDYPDGMPSPYSVWSSSDASSWSPVNNPSLFFSSGDKSVHYFRFVEFQNKTWRIGGAKPHSFPDGVRVSMPTSEVWNTSNGTDWKQVVQTAPWQGRSDPSVFTFQDKIWVYGGYTLAGEMQWAQANDLWNSNDGITWNKVGDLSKIFPGSERETSNTILLFSSGQKIYAITRAAQTCPYFSDTYSTVDGINWIAESLNERKWRATGQAEVLAISSGVYLFGATDGNSNLFTF